MITKNAAQADDVAVGMGPDRVLPGDVEPERRSSGLRRRDDGANAPAWQTAV